jgi:hypothetical protein
MVSCHTAYSEPVKQEVNGTVKLPPLVFLASYQLGSGVGQVPEGPEAVLGQCYKTFYDRNL